VSELGQALAVGLMLEAQQLGTMGQHSTGQGQPEGQG
jgi:hypothetical protein